MNLPNDILAGASGANTASQIQQAASGTSSAGRATTTGAVTAGLVGGTPGAISSNTDTRSTMITQRTQSAIGSSAATGAGTAAVSSLPATAINAGAAINTGATSTGNLGTRAQQTTQAAIQAGSSVSGTGSAAQATSVGNAQTRLAGGAPSAAGVFVNAAGNPVSVASIATAPATAPAMQG